MESFALETIRSCQTADREWRATSSGYSKAATMFLNEAHPRLCGQVDRSVFKRSRAQTMLIGSRLEDAVAKRV